MPRLVINPGSPDAWEIQLKPGTNFIGRGFSNDFKIPDGSVSSSHCEITLGSEGATIKDLGSTNGTFVNNVPVRESTLQPGQRIHLGQVELLYCVDTAGPIPADALVAAGATPANPPAIPAASPLKISSGQSTPRHEPMPTSAAVCASGSHRCGWPP